MTDRFRIMVVDDDRSSRQTTVQRLQELGHDSGPADSGPAALQQLRAGHWDVVLTDLPVPGMDALDFLRRVREEHPGIAVLFTSPPSLVATAIAAVRAGAADFLVEPFRPEELEVRLLRIREQAAARNELQALRAGGEIRPAHLPPQFSPPGTHATGEVFSLHLEGCERLQFNELLERFQDELIHWALARAGGQQKRAAELLGIPRTTLQSRMLRLRAMAPV